MNGGGSEGGRGGLGAAKILRFNLPWYLAALALLGVLGTLAAGTVAMGWSSPSWVRLLAVAGMAGAGYWMTASLLVSWFVYDRSAFAHGAWLDGVDPAGGLIAVFHAGQDEASAHVSARMPGRAFRVFDFHQRGKKWSGSLNRARALMRGSAESIPYDAVPLESGALTLGLLVFSAHELRSAEERVAMFRELARAAGPKGRIRVVEHLRDGWNFLAYGPGAFHFLPRRAWSHTFASAGWRVASERACTPFVRIFELEPGA
jgi:hypothetical protein